MARLNTRRPVSGVFRVGYAHLDAFISLDVAGLTEPSALSPAAGSRADIPLSGTLPVDETAADSRGGVAPAPWASALPLLAAAAAAPAAGLAPRVVEVAPSCRRPPAVLAGAASCPFLPVRWLAAFAPAAFLLPFPPPGLAPWLLAGSMWMVTFLYCVLGSLGTFPLLPPASSSSSGSGAAAQRDFNKLPPPPAGPPAGDGGVGGRSSGRLLLGSGG